MKLKHGRNKIRKSGNNFTSNFPLNTGAQDLILKSKFSEAVSLLYEQQIEEWPLLKKGTETLSSVKENKFLFDAYEIHTHFNPQRIYSTTADVSSEAVKKRPCFLCTENLPGKEQGIIYKDKYFILCNPYPIFKEHMTISNFVHKPQRIKKAFRYMLWLSKDLHDFCIIYNGPESGASAPDHQHFQACKKDTLPVIKNYDVLKSKYSEEIVNDQLSVYSVDDGLRKMLFLESDLPQPVEKYFKTVYDSYVPISSAHLEPMMNIIALYEEGTGWKMIIFFRGKHRPDSYFKEGDSNIIVSPATIDLAGVLVTPLEKDFNKIDKSTIRQIYREVSLGKKEFEYIISSLKG
jgi:hypothetical protein